jgi:hypothetical protein
MERFDVHVVLEVCEIAIESATIVAILKLGSKMACFEMTPTLRLTTKDTEDTEAT